MVSHPHLGPKATGGLRRAKFLLWEQARGPARECKPRIRRDLDVPNLPAVQDQL